MRGTGHSSEILDQGNNGRDIMNTRTAGRHRSAATGGERRWTPEDSWKAAASVPAAWCHGFFRQLQAAARPVERERGDVPGWVMITLMSAILVAGLLFIAEPALEQLFRTAMEQVKP